MSGDASTSSARTLRIGSVAVRFRGPAALLRRVLGPLLTLEVPPGEEAPEGTAVEVVVSGDGLPPEAVAVAGAPAAATRFVPEEEDSPARIVAPGLGTATLPEEGPVLLRVAGEPPEGDALAERLTIPALAERLRRGGLALAHGAVLLSPDRRGVLLVPAARGSGKTTLALSLCRHGWALLSDDRGWIGGDAAAPWIDPWPEAPRVGDLSLHLLPPRVLAGPRDPRTGKAPVPGLLPPRVARPLPILGVALPRLAKGPGGATRAVRGAAALAAVASQVVVATDPRRAAEALRFLADVLSRLPVHEVEVGDDPAAIARDAHRLVASAGERS